MAWIDSAFFEFESSIIDVVLCKACFKKVIKLVTQLLFIIFRNSIEHDIADFRSICHAGVFYTRAYMMYVYDLILDSSFIMCHYTAPKYIIEKVTGLRNYLQIEQMDERKS